MSRSTINRKTYIPINDNVQNIYTNNFSLFMCLAYDIACCASWSTTSIHFYHITPVKQLMIVLWNTSPYGILRFSLFHNCHPSSSWNHKSFPVKLKVWERRWWCSLSNQDVQIRQKKKKKNAVICTLWML